MDNKTKIITAAILALSASVAFAGGYSCSAQNVTIPCDTNGWHFLVEANYSQLTNDDLEYFRGNFMLGEPSQQFAVSSDHEFGWRVEGGWHYDHGRDVTASWSRFDERFSDSSIKIDVDGLEGDGVARFEVDIANLEFGQRHDVGDNAEFRLHFGGQYLRLEHYFMVRIESKEDVLPLITSSNHPSEFSGFGPRVGIDWYYHLSEGFQLTSHAAMALLVGDLDASYFQEDNNDNTPDIVISKFSRRTIVPHLEGRAGVRYNHKLDQGLLSVEGGWHVAGIYQSIHHVNPAKGRPLQNISNYGNHGPFLNIMFAAAA